MNTIAIKIKSYDSIANVISIMRKYCDLPIGAIKNNIENKNFVLEYSYLSHSGVKRIAKCYDELVMNGIVCDIYDEYEVIIDREILSNMIASHKQTELEVASQMESETK